MNIKKIISDTKLILDDIVSNQDVHSIYISGSIIEGFGNIKSDIDIFVITNKEPRLLENNSINNVTLTLNKEDFLIQNSLIEGTRYDVEYHDINKIQRILNKIYHFTYNGEYVTNPLSYDEQDFLHRLKIGIPIYNENAFFQFKKNLDIYKLSLHKSAIYIDGFNNLYEDAYGTYESNDFGSCYIMLLKLIDATINGYISIFGETNPNEKWIYRMIKSYSIKEKDETLMQAFIKFHNFQYKEDISKLEFTNFYENVMYFCQNLNIKTQKMIHEIQKE